jgi:hypothetical protein
MTVQQRRVHTFGSLVLLVFGLVPAIGCGLEEIDDGGELDEIPPAVQRAFDQSCATSSGCHGSGASLVVLSAPESAAILTGTSASGGGSFVTLGDLEGSYLAQKILGGSSIIGGVMPPSKQSDNDDVNAAIIIGWIAGVSIANGGDGDGDGDGDSDLQCFVTAPVPATPSFAAHIWPVIEARCMACHLASEPLMPDAATAHANLVSAPAMAAMADYVEPGSPDQSYLWHKLTGTFSSIEGGGGSTMPLGSALCPEEFQAIYAWILTGAEQ